MIHRDDPRRALAGAAFAAAMGLWATAAAAQDRTGWALNRYEPAPMGDAFFLAEHPWYSSTRLFSVGLYGDYAINPLQLVRIDPSGATQPTTDNLTGMFVLKGRHGISGRGAWLVGAGVLVPVMYWFAFVGTP